MIEAPEREGVYWGGDQRHIEELEVVGQIGQVGRVDVDNNAIAWVLSGFDSYTEARDVVWFEIPSTFSSWEDEMGEWFVGQQTVERDGETHRLAIPSSRVKAAMKSLTGGGHYDADDYNLIDAAPFPLLSGPEGAVAIAPVPVQID